jgi:hypothetical protein
MASSADAEIDRLLSQAEATSQLLRALEDARPAPRSSSAGTSGVESAIEIALRDRDNCLLRACAAEARCARLLDERMKIDAECAHLQTRVVSLQSQLGAERAQDATADRVDPEGHLRQCRTLAEQVAAEAAEARVAVQRLSKGSHARRHTLEDALKSSDHTGESSTVPNAALEGLQVSPAGDDADESDVLRHLSNELGEKQLQIRCLEAALQQALRGKSASRDRDVSTF